MDIESTDRALLIDSTQTETPVSSHSINNESKVIPVVYGRRWYILLLFSLLCFNQGCMWNTWGPLSTSTELVFNWTDTTTGLMNNWGCIGYFISSPFFAWVMDVRGMRWASVLTAMLLVSGSALRCITSSLPAFTWLTHAGQLLCGLSGPVVMGGTPVISTVWFPENQRTSATAFATVMGGMGTAVSFVLGPSVVPQCQSRDNKATAVCLESIERGVRHLMYIELGFAAFVCLLVLVYFPTRPPTPPSLTASIRRTDFKAGLKQLLRHKKFWMLGIAYAVSSGVMNAWNSVLSINLGAQNTTEVTSVLKINPVDLHINESEAGWIGFYCTIAGQCAAMGIGIFADLFARKMRLFLVCSYSLATAAIIVFILIYMGVITSHVTALVYVSIIIVSMATFGAVPLFYELVCESTYPIAEGVTNTLLTLLNNIAAGGFFFFLMFTNLKSQAWMNWTLLGSIVICLPIFCLYKERYGRLDVDTNRTENKNREDDVSNSGFQTAPETDVLF